MASPGALPFSSLVSLSDSTGAGTVFSELTSQVPDNGIEDLGNHKTSSSSSSQTRVGGVLPNSNTTTTITTCVGTAVIAPSLPPSSSEERKRGCSIHFQRQCCLANPDLQNYIATYSPPSTSESITPPTATVSPATVTETRLVAPVPCQEAGTGSLYSVEHSPSKLNNRPAMLHKPRRPSPAPGGRDRRHTITTGSHPMHSLPNALMPALPNTSMPDITARRPACQSSDPTPGDTTKRRTLDFIPWHHRASTSSTVRARFQISSPLAMSTPNLDLVDPTAASVSTLPQPIATAPRPVEAERDRLVKVDKAKPSDRHRFPGASNHVHIVRTSHPRATTSFMGRLLFFGARRRTRKVSDITGTFIIDPALRLPDAVFKVMNANIFNKNEEGDEAEGAENGMMEGGMGLRGANGEIVFPVLKNKDARARVKSMGRNSSKTEGVGQDTVDGHSKGSGKASDGSKRKNLTLKVQNGGINVDIHLVSNSHSQHPVVDRQHRTTMELVLEPIPNKNEAIRLPLIARLHAPSPRPPFHLIARTCPPQSHPLPTPFTLSKPLPRQKVRFDLSNKRKSISGPLNVPPSPFYLKASASASSIMNQKDSALDAQAHAVAIDNTSYLSIHVPRSFHGPLTLTVLSGNLDAHISLSDALRDRSVVLREDGCTRGYFVGPLGEANETKSVCAEAAKGYGQRREVSAQEDGGCVYDESVSSARTSTDEPRGGKVEENNLNKGALPVNRVIAERHVTDISNGSPQDDFRNTEREYVPCSEYERLSERDETPREGSGRFNFSSPSLHLTKPISSIADARTLSPSPPIPTTVVPGVSSTMSKNKVKRKPVTFPADLRVDELDALIQGASVHCQHSYPPPVVDSPMMNLQGRQPGWKITRSQSVNGRTRVLSEIRPPTACGLRTPQNDNSEVSFQKRTPKDEYFGNHDAKLVAQEGWLGDQIDIIVGAGKIHLQYEDEKASLWTGDAWRKWCWETFRV